MKKPIPETNMIFHWKDETFDSSSAFSRLAGTVVAASSCLHGECMKGPVNSRKHVGKLSANFRLTIASQTQPTPGILEPGTAVPSRGMGRQRT